MTDARGEIAVDFIGKLENFAEDWKHISDTLGLSTVELVNQKLNASKHKPYQEYYTKELQELVYNYYKEDFDLLGYSQELL